MQASLNSHESSINLNNKILSNMHEYDGIPSGPHRKKLTFVEGIIFRYETDKIEHANDSTTIKQKSWIDVSYDVFFSNEMRKMPDNETMMSAFEKWKKDTVPPNELCRAEF